MFKKKKRITKADYEFLKAVVHQLPSKYSYLFDQVTKEFILDKKINEFGDEGTYTLVLNAELENNFTDKSLPQLFIIKDLGVWNKKTESYEQIELHILEGMLAGFKVDSPYSDLDNEKINTSNIKEKHFKNEDIEYLRKLLDSAPENLLSDLDIESTFKIEIPEGVFYVIKDFRDGNYMCMDADGAVYGMFHDPYEIKKLFVNKEAFFHAMIYENFSIQEYYDKKMS